MKLRPLKKEDAPLMLEWMHDSDINRFFCFDAAGMDLDSVYQFIEKANRDNEKNKHFAIADDKDEYMGTISLKQIDDKNSHAEYAVSLRAKAQGKGYAKFATREILAFAFNELKLNKVYLNVLSYNTHAIRFYEKTGFKYEGEFLKHIRKNDEFHDIKWYAFFKEDFR